MTNIKKWINVYDITEQYGKICAFSVEVDEHRAEQTREALEREYAFINSDRARLVVLIENVKAESEKPTLPYTT